MHGNVWEWVEDAWHPNYQGAPHDGSVWQGGDTSLRVLRGGSWLDIPAPSARPTARDRPDNRDEMSASELPERSNPLSLYILIS